MRKFDRIDISPTGDLYVAWHEENGNSDSAFITLEKFEYGGFYDADVALALHIIEQHEAIEALMERLERLERLTGHTCQDEGCPHFGSPHAHPDFSADATVERQGVIKP